MRKQQTDILKQPIPTLLFTFVALLVAQTFRAATLPNGADVVRGVLSPLGAWIDSLCGEAGIVVSVLSVVVGSVIVTRIISRYALSVVRSFVPMVLFVVGVCGIIFPASHPSIALALLMTIHSTDLMIMSFKRSEQFSEVMRASFWMGLATLIVPDLIYVLALLPLHWVVWQRSPREMVASVIMFLQPLIPASFCWWVGGKEPLWLLGEWCNALTPLHAPDFPQLFESVGGVWSALLFGVLTLLTLLSVVIFFLESSSMRLRARKGHVYFSVLYFVGLFMLLCGSHPAIAITIIGYASTPLVHTFFAKRKGVASVVIYVAMVCLALVASILPML